MSNNAYDDSFILGFLVGIALGFLGTFILMMSGKTKAALGSSVAGFIQTAVVLIILLSFYFKYVA